jgi:hypothetical protein
MKNYLILLFLKILLIFIPFNSYSKIYEGESITCSEQDLNNDSSKMGLAYCEEKDSDKWFAHIKNQKFNGYALQLFSTGAILISNIENGSMGNLGYYQKKIMFK